MGHYLLFDTAQRSEQVQIARVDLLPHVPKYREDEFRELFRPSKTPGTPTSPAHADAVDLDGGEAGNAALRVPSRRRSLSR